MSDADDKTRRVRRQDAVWWVRTGTDSFGKPVYADPADLKVRWTDMAQMFVNDKGEQVVSKSIVFVGEDMRVGDVLMLGTVAGSVLPGKKPLQHPGASEVRQFRKTPDRSARKFVRKAVL